MRVLLADDHDLFREGMAMVLARAGHEVVGEAADGRAALTETRRLEPDVVVMDIAMPRLNGIDATRQLVTERPALAVVALTQYTVRQHVVRALQAGAVGFVPKAARGDELLQALEAIRAGKRYLSPDVTAGVVEGALAHATNHNDGSACYAFRTELGSREREVLQLLAEGHTSPQIADHLHVSVKTVEAHRRNIMRKLDCHTIAELTKYAVREGITSLER
jgi:two-component system NarL family response regulator